jgi:predicted small metal-binding protein
VIEYIKSNYNTKYGVRSIQHEVERKIVNLLARAHEMDEINEGSKAHVYYDVGGIQLQITKAKDTSRKFPLSIFRS